jgi:hypothetical protein
MVTYQTQFFFIFGEPMSKWVYTSVGRVLAFFSQPDGQGIFFKTICEAWRAWVLEIFKATYT